MEILNFLEVLNNLPMNLISPADFFLINFKIME